MRNIERGSVIVATTSEKLVFQLPRGNLETINHRVILLKKVNNLIKLSGDFNTAFELCRTNKLDLNLVFDLAPKQFLEKTKEILLSFKKTEYINLLVSNVKQGLT